MYTSKLHHTQIDKFHHIARLGVYALLTLSVIATTISLNRPGTSVGSSGARAAASTNPVYTCTSFKIVTSDNGAGAANPTIGADYSGGKLIYYVDIEPATTGKPLLNVQGIFVPLRSVGKSPDGKKETFSLDLSPYTPPEDSKGKTFTYSASNMTMDGVVSVGGNCSASLTIGSGPTPTPPPAANTATPTPTPAPAPNTPVSTEVSCNALKIDPVIDPVSGSPTITGNTIAAVGPGQSIRFVLGLNNGNASHKPTLLPYIGSTLVQSQNIELISRGSGVYSSKDLTFDDLSKIQSNATNIQFNAQLLGNSETKVSDDLAWGVASKCVASVNLVRPTSTPTPTPTPTAGAPKPFDPGSSGSVTIPDRLWLKYQITIGSGLVAGDKIVIAAKKYGSELKACSGRLGYSEFAMSNQFIECRQGAGTRTLIIKLVGQEEIKSWLAGSELLWGVKVAGDTSTGGPTPGQSKGITVFTGRGQTGIVGNIKYSGETEQFIEIPFTINR